MSNLRRIRFLSLLLLLPALIAAAPKAPAHKAARRKKPPVAAPQAPTLSIDAPASADTSMPAPVAPSLADSVEWRRLDVENAPFQVFLPEGWMAAQRSNFDTRRIVVPPSHNLADSTLSRNVVGLAVKLFRDGAQFVAGELGRTLQPGEAPIMVWLDKLDVPPGKMGTARIKTIENMEELTMAPVWDTTLTVREHPVLWLESHRPAVKNDSMDLPSIRVISVLFDEPSGSYRWTSTFKEDRTGALELVNRLLQNLEVR